MICSKSVFICNHFHARLVDSSRNHACWLGTILWSPLMEDSLNVGCWNLHCYKSTLNARNFTCKLSWSISSDLGAIHCWNTHRSSLKLQKKIAKIAHFGGSRSSMLVPPKSLSALLVMIRSKSVSICNHSYARWVNSGKITISSGGTPLCCPCSRRIFSPSGTKLVREKLATLRHHVVKTQSLYLTCAWFATGTTPGQTDKRTELQ